MFPSRKVLKLLIAVLLVAATCIYLRSAACLEKDYEKEYNHEDVGRRYAQRREQMRKTCETLEKKKEPVRHTIRNFMFRLWNYNVSLCSIPKCGWTTWVENMKKLNGRHPLYDERRFKLLRQADDVITRGVRDTVTLISVRHPLVRLVSAFRNKFLNGRPVEKVGGYLRMAIQVLQLPADRNYISFSEFLVHVISTRRHADRHWSTYRQLCSPCYFHYDYIALLETYTEDMQYLAQELGIPIDPEARRNAKSVPGEDESAAAFRYYRNVTLPIRRQIVDIFKEDMEMFDYKLPDDFWLSDDDEVSLVS